MSLLHTLRNSPWLAKLALLWYVVTLGVAVAAPMVNPPTELVVCTSVGMVKVVLNDDGTTATSTSNDGMHCPLCSAGGAQAPVSVSKGQVFHPSGHVLKSIPKTHLAALTAVQPPARGPPSI